MRKKKSCIDCGKLITAVPRVTRCLACNGRQRHREREQYYQDNPVPCTHCQRPTILHTKNRRDIWRQSRRAYCSQKCLTAHLRQIRSEKMEETNGKYSSLRMRQNNPMKNAINRQKVSMRLKAMHHRPCQVGGNGRPLPEPQVRLARALGWPTEVIIKTGQSRGSGYPFCYKVDIGLPELRIAVEVDGASHGALERQTQDQKKTTFLAGLGWIVLRFSNEDVMQNLSGCVQTVKSLTSKLQASTRL